MPKKMIAQKRMHTLAKELAAGGDDEAQTLAQYINDVSGREKLGLDQRAELMCRLALACIDQMRDVVLLAAQQPQMLDAARALVAVDRRGAGRAKVKKAGEELAEDVATLNRHVVEMMLQQDAQRITIAGHTVYMANFVNASFLKDHKPPAIAVMRENQIDDLVEESVNSQRLSSFVKERARPGAVVLELLACIEDPTKEPDGDIDIDDTTLEAVRTCGDKTLAKLVAQFDLPIDLLTHMRVHQGARANIKKG